jgi:hypothetical protein
VFLAFLFKKQFCVDQKTLFGGVFTDFEYLSDCRKKAVFEPFCEIFTNLLFKLILRFCCVFRRFGLVVELFACFVKFVSWLCGVGFGCFGVVLWVS